MQEKPSEYDEQVHPPHHPPELDDPATGEEEPANEDDRIEPDVPPAFDPAVRPAADK